MHIGIIVYSRTGNTLSVAQRMKEALLEAGHSVSLEQITVENEDPSKEKNIALKHVPDPAGYDAVLFGAPVWAFSACPVMKLYLSRLPALAGKKAGVFVTQQLSRPWLGGNRAVRQMARACRDRQAVVCRTGIVNWSNQKREEQITALLQDFSRL